MEIAVIGIACRFPGSQDQRAYWRNLAGGRASISEVPEKRWDWRAYWGDPATQANKSLCKWGGFIDDVDAFDHSFFGLLPKVVQSIDPAQRIMLELAWACLEEAGIAPARLRGRKVGVMVGVYSCDYKELQERSDTAIEAHYSTGTMTTVIPNRISHFFDLRGPSIAISAACSSSLNAIHSAIEAIEYGDCEMALAGGVNLMLTPTLHMSLSKMGLMSPTGRCNTLDAAADGYVRGEGAAFILLKPLEQALADGDAIHGIIKGSAVNHCGQTYTLSYPSPQAQADVIVAAHERAGVPVTSISYIEMHGTGTPKGDPIEFQGLVQAFNTLAQQQGVALPAAYCALGAVKTNIGHLESAAGIAGVIKVLLALKHRSLPGLHGFTQLNPRITIEGTPFYVLDGTREWHQDDERQPRRAGVSAFGFGGTNAHLVLEEAPRRRQARSRAKAPTAHLIALSAKSADALRQRQRDLLAWLREDAGATPLADVAATLLTGRDHLSCRYACVADDAQQVIEALEQPIAAENAVAPASALTPEQVAHGQKLLAQLGGKAPLPAAKYREGLRELASLYVAGADLWPALYAGRRAQRVRLPTYPFARDRHWIPEAAPEERDGAGGAGARLHPLLHRNVSKVGAQRFSSMFDGGEFFLADHRIGERPMLPAVAYLEMVRAAVAESCDAAGAGAVEITELVWLQPLEYAGEPLAVQVELVADGSQAAAVEFGVTTGSDRDATLHCRGRARFVEATAATIDVAALERDCTGPVLGAEECYRSFDALGFHYGPAHRNLSQLRCGAGQCLVELSAPPVQRAAFVLHPGLVDSALQASLVLAGVTTTPGAAALLPFSADRVVVHAPCNGPMRAWIRYSPGHGAHEPFKKLDVDLFAAGPERAAGTCLEIRGLGLQAAMAEASAAPRATVPPELAGSLYAPVWTAQPLEQAPQARVDELLLVGRPEDVDWLEPQLRGSAHFAATHIARLCWGGDGAAPIRPASFEDHERAVAALAAAPTHVLLVAPRAKADPADADEHDMLDAAQGLFALTRALMRRAKQLKIVHWVAGAQPAPWHLGLSGYYKTLRIEKPSYSGRVVACAAEALKADDLARMLRDELCATDRETDVRYAGAARSIRRFSPVEAMSSAAREAIPDSALRQHGVYLITGGMGTLGRIVARHLCAKYQATVYLTGRSALGADQTRALEELSALGGKAHYLVCDAANRDDVRRAVSSVREAGHRLHGVIHSAGVIEDAFILRKHPDAFARVIAPKALGTRNLDLETRDEPLDLFVLFSSVAGVLGNIGQSDYAFGNACEDYYAHQRAAMGAAGLRPGRTLSINWPYWKDGGMRLTDKEEEILRRTFGIVPLQTADGLAALEYGLRQPHAQLVLMQGDGARIHEVMGVTAATTPAAANAARQDSGSEPTADEMRARIARHLAETFAAQMQMSANFELDRPLREYGFDSVVMIDLINQMEKSFGKLPKTLFFEHPTLGELTTFLVESHADACRAITGPAPATAEGNTGPVVRVEAATPVAPVRAAAPARRSVEHEREGDGIAIIGLAGRYPQAETLEEFWENLKLGRDCVVEIPSDRWDAAATFQPGAPVQGKSYGKWGGFLRGVDRFDPLFFNISPKEAEYMDPNERLFLETVAHTIEDAGYTPDKLAPSDGVKENPVGVFVGVMWGEYQLHGVDGPRETWATPHTWYWAVANRISHFFNLSGPSLTIDTACSSSLTAIHLACAAILRGEISAAIAGGVNLSLHPYKYNQLSELRFLSTNGRCVSFGKGGDGYVPGEGVGAVLLKSLARARADGDHIYGIIRGTAVNHGGKSSGFTVPNSKRQAALIQEALETAAVDPRHISYVEAHGTGTALGDPIEITGLTNAYRQAGRQYCAIGSVKSNIGHLEAASGIAALTKVLLQMQHRMLVPSIHADTLNPYINFDDGPFVVQRTLAPWQRPRLAQDPGGGGVELPRLAGISSFGAGGANAHIIVEECVDDVRDTAGAMQRPVLLVLSARKEKSLRAMAGRLAARIAADPDLSLDDVAYTLQVGRVPLELRFAMVAANAAEAVAGLRTYGEGGSAPAGAHAGHSDEIKGAGATLELAELPAWLERRDLARIAAAWVRGASVEWERLYAAGTRRRVSLPGYAYDRQRYWIEKPQVTTLATVAALHPLIDANVSTLEEQTFRKVLRPEEFFLRDHRLGGNRVLPAVAYLEMVLQACRLASPSHVAAALRDVSWLRPIVVNEGEVIVDVGLLPEADGLRFEVYQLEDGQRLVYASGFVELAAPPEAVPPHRAGGIDLQAVIGRCRAYGRADVTAAFDRMGLHLGPSFQVIDALYCNANEACARLIASAPTEAGDWLLHPALLDGAVRTVLGVGGLGADTTLWVPAQMRRLELRRPVVGDCAVLAVPADGVAARADRRQYDVTLLGTDGAVLVSIEGLAAQAAPQLALMRVPQRKAAAKPGLPPVTALAARAHADAAIRADAGGERPPRATTAVVHEAVVRHLTELLSGVTKVPVHQIDTKAALENYGIDSVMILTLTEKLQQTFGDVPKTLFFEYQDLHSLADYFVENWSEQAHALVQGLPAAAPAEVAPTAGAEDVDSSACQAVLLACLHEVLGDAAAACTASTPLADWPLDPISNCRLLHRLQKEFEDVEPNAMYRYASPSEWARALRRRSAHPQGTAPAVVGRAMSVAGTPGATRFARLAAALDQEIAIVGLSGRYPGADNVEQFWANLCAGKDCITEIPAVRWDYRPHFNPDRSAKGESYSKWGGFIDGIDRFDAGFFNISARQAELLDPQERLFLQTAWECLEDACYPRPALKGRSAGVFVGVMWGQYELIDVSDAQRQYGRPTASFSSIANRLSYFLNLSGPSIALDTMCSSSLTAIHLACQAIRNGDCEMAIAGGVNLIVHPNKYRQLAQSQFLSSDGRCRAFGAGGDGYVPGEGVGAVLLRPYRQALADGDQIYGLIKASALNHGGKTNGYTVPNQIAQSNVIGTALRRTGWHPGSIDYIEAHGTGTSLGDPIEIAALSKAFAAAAAEREQRGEPARPLACRIGSVKSNVGHLESAAAIAGLTKILLQLRHGRIAPSLHSATLNPNIDFAHTPFRVVQQLEDWSGAGRAAPRRAGISSFGAGGSNAHLLIEEHVPQAAEGGAGGPVIFVLSADGEERLTLYIDRVLAFLAERAAAGRPVELRSLAWSSQVGREAMEERLAVVAGSVADLVEALTKYRQNTAAANLQRGSVRRHGDKLDAIMDAAEQGDLIRSLLRRGRLQQLASAWVSFLDVDWAAHAAQLYGDRRPPRMSFPTMPFLTQRYWVQEKAESATVAAALHPLLDANISTLSQQAYGKELRGDEFYLRDHVVEAGTKRLILPGAAYVEMARAAGELCMGPDWSVSRIRNLLWIQPIEIKDRPESVQVNLRQTDDRIEFEILRGGDEVCVEGELGYSRRGEAAPDEWLDLTAVRTGGLQEDHDAIYAGFRQIGFHFGPSFQVTQTRYRMPGAALSRLVLPEALRSDAGRYELHPSLLDGIFRTCLALVDATQTTAGPIVPFALGELEIRHPLPQECWACATEAPDSAPDASGLRKYDITVADATGRVLLKVKDFAGRMLTKSAEGPHGSLQYYRYDWLETPLEHGGDRVAGATVLVLGADEELPRCLVEHGVFARVVSARATTSESDDGYHVDPTHEESWRRLLARLDAQGARPTHVVLHADGAGDPPDASELAPNDTGVLSIRALFRALEQQHAGQAVRCAYVYAAGRDEHRPQHDAVSAIARSFLTINHRYELFTLRHDQRAAAELAEAVSAELAVAGNASGHEIAWWNGVRYQRCLSAAAPGASAHPQPLRERGAYLITGGAGKLGLVFATHLAQRYHARLVLSGRSAQPNAAQRAAIDAMCAAGAEVHYVRADVTTAADVDALVAEARQRFGGLNGVIHCAGVAAGGTVTELDAAEFARLYATKAEGARLLDHATRDEPLDFFVYFSSVSAVLGDPGAGAYAAGNRFLDTHALWRDALRLQGKRSGQSIAIGWPLWASGGMEIAGAQASVFGYSGMAALTQEQGVAAFEEALRGELAQVLVATGDADKIARALRVRATAGPIAIPVAVAAADVPPPVPEAAQNGLLGRVELYVKERLAKVVKTVAADIRAEQTFQQCGMDSVMLMELHASLAQDIAGLPKTVLFEHDSPALLAQYLVRHHAGALEARLGAAPAPSPVPSGKAARVPPPVAIRSTAAAVAQLPPSRKHQAARPRPDAAAELDAVAIIGMAGEFPLADDLAAFWENVLAGRDCLVPIPEERWSAAAAGSPRGGRDARRCHRGGFLRDAHQFDPALFGMSQAEAERMDPQLRVLLRSAWRALEDAAYTPEALGAQRVGVYTGAMNEDHTWIMSELRQRRGEYLGPGSVFSEFANRISFLLNFRGPSLTVGTACSSSLTSVHLARKAILDGECDVALAGGANLSLHPSKYLLLEDMKVLSPDGHERTFDEAANGLVPSEGAGVVVLKRLRRALADGDQIHGVLRASCISHSGTGAGLYVPNLRVIEETVARGIRESGLPIEELTYIEPHGAGTKLGDPIELKALANALQQLGAARRFCAIGTKANLGHMEAASGVCSLIKVLLAMRHGKLAPCAGLKSLNSSFDDESLPFHFPRQAQDWLVNTRGTRVAGINSFGMGGSNAFVVVESHAPGSPQPASVREPAVLVLSARSPQALHTYLKSVCSHLRDNPAAAHLADLAYSSQVGRVAFEHRLAVVAANAGELVDRAERYLKSGDVGGVHAGSSRANEMPELLAGDAGEHFIDALAQARQWDKLAALWVRGCAVDWQRIYAGSGRRRVSFPSAPFENVTCDILSTAGAMPALAGGDMAASLKAAADVPVPAGDAAVSLQAAADVPAAWFQPGGAPVDLDPSLRAGEANADGDEGARQYWLDHLRDATSTALVLAPALLPGRAEGGNPAELHLHAVSATLTGALVESLQRCTQLHRIEAETLIAAAWAILVNRYTKAPCSQFGILRAFAPAGSGACGMRSLVPMRIRTVGRERVSSWLPALQQDLDRKRVYAHTPLQRIEGWTGVESLFDSVIAFERPPSDGAAPQPSGQSFAPEMNGAQARVAMELKVTIHQDRVTLDLIYKATSAQNDTMGTVLEQLKVLLEELASHPERNPAALAMRTKSEGRDRFWKALENTGEAR